MSLSLEDAAKLGGSDIAGILGLSPWQTPLSIYARVASALEGRALPHEDSAPKRRGRHLEAAVLRLYEEETALTVVPNPGTPPLSRPYFRASLDAVAFDGTPSGPRRVVEVKTAGLSEARQWGEAGADDVPQQYLFQVMWYLGHALQTRMVDLDTADVAALVGGDLRVYVVRLDPELFAMLEAALDRFWKDHMLPRRPPPVTEPLRDVDAAGAIYPRHSGDERHWDTLGTEEQRAVRDWLKARARLKRAELRAAGAEAVLKMALGTTPKVYGLPESTGARSISWRKNKDGRETDWQSALQMLHARGDVSDMQYKEIVAEHTTAKEGARPLRVTETREEE